MPGENEREHDKYVRMMKDFLEDDKYTVELENVFAGRHCDILATRGKEKLCIEVETSDNLDNAETRAKWEALSGNREWDFGLAVHKDNLKKAKALLDEWHIYFKIIYTFKNGD